MALLPLAFLIASALYSSVGHAGASGYLAAMAFLFVLWRICLWLYRRKLFVRI